MTSVLVVEDSPTQAVQLQLLLESEGLEVKVAGRLDQALSALANNEPDVILLDLILPDATGLDGLARVQQCHPACPVVVLTALADDATAVEAVKQGAQDYLVKGRPDSALLVRTIRYAIERNRIKRELEMVASELRDKNLQLEQLNEQKNYFIGIAAHDLRNPLGISLAYSKFLLEKFDDNLSEKQLKFVSTIKSNSEFMLHLINDLLDVSSIESGKLQLDLQPCDIVALTEQNLTLNSVLAEQKQIRLQFTSEGEIPRLSVDMPKIEQVLNNLVSNAIKFSFPESTVEVSVNHKGDDVLIAVRDHGQGIPTEEQSGLFRPFEKTSVKSTGGEKSTGLGLTIVRKIVQGHGGDITVESEVGKGSTFFVRIPVN